MKEIVVAIMSVLSMTYVHDRVCKMEHANICKMTDIDRLAKGVGNILI